MGFLHLISINVNIQIAVFNHFESKFLSVCDRAKLQTLNDSCSARIGLFADRLLEKLLLTWYASI